jgi:hypothetical protein
MSDDSTNTTVGSMLTEMLSAENVRNALSIGQHRIENVGWFDFSYYEFLIKPQVFHIDTTVNISANTQRVLENLDDSSIAVSDVLEFFDHLSKSIVISSYRSLNLLPKSNLYLPLLENPDSRTKLVDAYLETLIDSGKLSSLFYAYFAIKPHLRTKLLSAFRFDTENLNQILWSIKGDNKSFAKSDLVAEWSKNIDSVIYRLEGKELHSLLRGSSFANIVVVGDPPPTCRPGHHWDDMRQRCVADEPAPLPPDHGPTDGPGEGNIPTGDDSPPENPPESSPNYSFDPYAPYSWNIGLRYLYRQEWRPLGIQRGDTVKTIPLGPKQVEKISTKIVKRTKVTTTSESLKAAETTTETSDNTKDSNEIVNEASKTFGWHVDAEASASWGWGSAKVSGGVKSDSENKTKSTSNQLSETMQKTASKIRTESKIVVSTEAETTFEETTASEIQNPNDEIALTYVYSKLQRQYEIFTSLNQLDGVLFVAEPMVLASEIDEEWVRNYDWIISEVLLDNSFRDALTSISQEIEPINLSYNEMGRINNAMDSAATGKFPANITSVSIASADISQEAQRGYRETLKEELEKQRNRLLAEKKRKRFLQHIRDNILHYYRAIWSKEDSEQRLLRYQKKEVMIPTVWKLVLGSTVITDFDSDTIDDGVLVNAHFEPDLSNKETMVPIEDLIEPAQPIGFVGNYAVFKIKQVPKIDEKYQNDLFDMLNLAKSAYIDPNSPETLIDPQLRAIKEKEEVPTHIPKKVRLEMVDIVPDLRSEYEALSKDDKASFLEQEDNFTDDLYWEYLFRKRNIRRFVVDTNNLIADIEVGNGSALESFKKLHRYIDVLKASKEMDKMELENNRRQKLLAKGKLSDPDIEKVTVVTDGKKALVPSLDVTDEQ